MLIRIIAVLLGGILSLVNAEDAVMKLLPELIKEYRTIESSGEGVVGKLDGLITKLKAAKPSEAGQSYEIWGGAMGELCIANGSYAEAIAAMKSTAAAMSNDASMWKDILTAMHRSQGKAAAMAEYERVLALIERPEMRYHFSDMVAMAFADPPVEPAAK